MYMHRPIAHLQETHSIDADSRSALCLDYDLATALSLARTLTGLEDYYDLHDLAFSFWPFLTNSTKLFHFRVKALMKNRKGKGASVIGEAYFSCLHLLCMLASSISS